MDRRRFLSFLTAGVAGIVLEQAIPLGRVWSFPKKIVVPDSGVLGRAFGFDWVEEVNVGSHLAMRFPQRFIVRDYIGDFSQSEKYKTVTLLKPSHRFSIDNVIIEE